MKKLYILMGKSAAGKDTVMSRVIAEGMPKKITHTTRPMRENEENGREYFFETEETHNQALKNNTILEQRVYNTTKGLWYYWSDTSPLEAERTVTVSTLEGYKKLKAFYGDAAIPVYIYCRDDIRMERLLKREEAQKNPDYKEICRRFIADSRDFGEELLLDAGVSETDSWPCEDEQDLEKIVKFITEK